MAIIGARFCLATVPNPNLLNRDENKKRSENQTSLISYCDLARQMVLTPKFQTFEELDSIKDKEAEVQQIRQLLDEKNTVRQIQ
jgi:hypothetical protein